MSQGSTTSDARLAAAYQELILDHYRRPRNRGPLARADAQAELRNPLCGDEVTIAVALDERGRVTEARFTGTGCSISQAAASMLTGLIRGKTLAEVAELQQRFAAMLGGDAAAAHDAALGDLRALAGVARVPVRAKCAMLAWRALDEAVKGLGRGATREGRGARGKGRQPLFLTDGDREPDAPSGGEEG